MRWAGRSRRRDSREEDLLAIRRVAEEDVLHLGEELARFDRRTAGSVLDEDGRVELQTALDAYESASGMVERLGSADEVSRVVDTQRRTVRACPGRRTPGAASRCRSAVRRASSTPGTDRPPPRCSGHALDVVRDSCRPVDRNAARHAAGEEPEVRYLEVDGRRIPCWEAGALLEPYTRGYFPTTVTEGRRDARGQAAVWQISDPGGVDHPGSF